jgi:hypothetical protein
MENVIKECGEEASVPLELARQAKAVGCVSYTTVSDIGELFRLVTLLLLLLLPPPKKDHLLDSEDDSTLAPPFPSFPPPTLFSLHSGLKPDVLFVFDLKLPESFVPKPDDGEVGGCHSVPTFHAPLPSRATSLMTSPSGPQALPLPCPAG